MRHREHLSRSVAGCLLALGLLGSMTPQAAAQATWKAGAAVTNVTPSEWLWMGGYAARNKPAEGKEMDLWLKALALEDSRGNRGVIVTCDILGFPRSIYVNACKQLERVNGLKTSQVILSASHTHCGPVLRESAMDAYALSPEERAKVERYSASLEQALVSAVGQALANMAPARLASGQGTATFAVNRRNNLERDITKARPPGELNGPIDHSVPVLSVTDTNGQIKTVLFGYACHNTVMSYYNWSGDYAGFAQLEIEKRHTNATAMFFMGCGGDQNPLPRRELAMARRYGASLADSVEEVLASHPKSLTPKLDMRMETIDLRLGPTPTHEELQQLLDDPKGNPTWKRWASRLIAQLKSGTPPARAYPYPVQAWRFGGRQLLVTLGGEPVVDYSLAFKQQFGSGTWVAGYCNDVMGYIPSARVLKEDAGPPKAGWGYEGAKSMMPYGLPAFRWDDSVQDQVTEAVGRLVSGWTSPQRPTKSQAVIQ